MLSALTVKNFALIDELSLQLQPGFTAITGETGAGKSIILGALALILGKRADLSAVRDQSEKCVVEGHFNVGHHLKPFFAENDLDFEDLSIIRREISPSGKSRAFVNDTPVTLDVLEKLSRHLIDIHSQHHTLLLNDINFQLSLLDSFASNESERQLYAEALRDYRSLEQQKDLLESRAAEERGDSDYLQFLWDELEQARLKEGEQEELENDLLRAENAAEISGNLTHSLSLLDQGEYSILHALQQLSGRLSSIEAFDKGLPELRERVESARIDLDDLRGSLEEMLNGAEHDPAAVEFLENRLSTIIQLQRKHKVESVEELLSRQRELGERIEFVQNLEESLKDLSARIAQSEEVLREKALKLHHSRERVIEGLQKATGAILEKLNLKEAQFLIRLQQTENFQESGNDKIDFLFTANPGKAPEKLKQVASGGELSRVMLALKSIMARSHNLPTIIFDEIDAGVSGETAGRIGDILQQMGEEMQVIAITHLPQIASRSAAHLKVSKAVIKENTFSRLEELQGEERLREIARLLSGDKISEAALENARHLMSVQN